MTPQPNPYNRLNVYIAIVIILFLFFAPTPKNKPSLQAFVSSADACPFKCVRCTSWDPDAWPRTCATYECDAECEAGDPGGGGGGNQPPSISHTLTCTQNGLNSWCMGALSIDLTASDPQNAAVVISGDVSGANFTCTTNPCNIPLPEGSGLVTYKADSATGLSASGSAFYYRDVTTPKISGSVNGSSGTNGWYTTQTLVNASAADALSGIALFEMNVDPSTGSGQGWATYSDTTFTDGIYTIQFRAYDNAGNYTETAVQEIKVDTAAPALNVATTGATGANGWYISNVTLTPNASDSTSGLVSLEMTADGGPWTVVTSAITLNDGIHSVQFRAIDNAGNVTQTVLQEIKVDATTPSLSLNISGTRGQNDWYVSAVSVTPNASDAGSSIHTVEAKINGGAWVPVTSNQSSVFSDGVHTYQYRVTDNAGNMTETPALPMRVDTVPPVIAIYDDSLNLGDTLTYDLEDPSTRSGQVSGLWINRSVIEDDGEKYKKIVWLEEITGNKSNNHEIRWDGVFMDGTKAEPGQYFITFKVSDRAGNESMRTATVEVTAFNSIVPIPAFAPPVNGIPEPVPGGSAPANEPAFGGETNQASAEQTTTITEGGAQATLEGMSLQAGGSTFSAGNQSTNSQATNPNILWGAAAAATLGATLAEWQRRREEEEAARRAAMFRSSGGDEEDENSDVLAKRRAKVMAKNEAKRDQESRWEAARQAENQKKDEAIEAAWNQSRRVHSLESMSATIASQTAQREQERLNEVSAARWAGLASVAQGKEESEKKNTGGKVLAMPVREDDPPTWWEKYVVQPWNKYIVQPAKNIWDKFTSLFTKDSTNPTSTPAALPTQTQFPTVVFTPTISISPTVTPTPTQSKIYKIDGPMTVDQVPSEFICTLPEWKVINGQNLRNLYYDRCKIGEELMVELLTNPTGWWWQDGMTEYFDWNKNILVVTSWEGVKTNEDFWRLPLAYGLDTEGTTLRRDNINGYGPLIEEAILNKFWHFDLGVRAQYGKPDASSGIYDPNDSSPLGTNGRLVALGSLQSLEMRNNVLQPPMDGSGSSTYMWDDSWNTYPNLFANEPAPGWQPLPNAPYEVGNIDSDHFYYKIKNVEDGPGKFEVLYRSSPTPASVRAIVLTFEQFAVYSQHPK